MLTGLAETPTLKHTVFWGERADVTVVSLCRHRRKKFLRKYSPSLKCTGLPNEGKFCKSNASFAYGSQNSTLSNDINDNTLSFLYVNKTDPKSICYQLVNFTICEKWQNATLEGRSLSLNLSLDFYG